MQVLVHLAERQGQVVSRQELEQLVWTGTVVGYEAVTNAVIKLGKARGLW
jgi:DNA-binding winged helix-turn-helix (wHTH) protein